MENHFFDASGAYTESSPAHHGFAVPHNAIRVKPELREGFWPVLNERKDGWNYVPDLRGTEGWNDIASGEAATSKEASDEDAPLAGCTESPVDSTENAADARVQVYITRRGVYHRKGCQHVLWAGEWITREQARARARNRACKVCHPDGETTQ